MALIYHTTSLASDVELLRSGVTEGRVSGLSMRSSTALAQARSSAGTTLLNAQASGGAAGEADDARTLPVAADRPPCGKGWPAFWMAVLLGYGPMLVNELLIVNLAAAGFTPGGKDPCDGQTCYNPYYPEGVPNPMDWYCWFSQPCVDALSKIADSQSWSSTLAYALAFFFGPIAGYLCDTWGRKPVIFVSAILLSLPSCSLLALHYGWSPYWYYATVPLIGFMPINVGWGTVLADRTLPTERAPIYAMLLAGEDLDGVVLPLIVSRVPQMASIIMIISMLGLMIIIIVFFLKETMTKERREEQRQLAASNNGGQTPSRLAGLKSLFTDPRLRMITALAFLSSIVQAGVQAIILPFYKARFGLNGITASPLFSVYYATNFVMNVFLVAPLIKCMGMRKLLLFAYSVWFAFSVSMFFVESVTALYFVIALSCFASAALPSYFALFNNAVPPEMRSQMVASVVSIQSLGKMCGPLLYNQLYSYLLTTDLGISAIAEDNKQVGIVFLVSAVILVFSMLMILCLPQSLFRGNDEAEAEPQPLQESALTKSRDATTPA